MKFEEFRLIPPSGGFMNLFACVFGALVLVPCGAEFTKTTLFIAMGCLTVAMNVGETGVKKGVG